jgi:hypothetical protein
MYDTGRYEAVMVTAAGVPTTTIASTGQKLFWTPGMVPHIIRGISVNINVTPGDAGVLRFDKRVTYSDDTNIVTGVATINMLTTHTFTGGTQARVVYVETNILINPGEELVMNVTDASASTTAAKVTLWLEAAYARPLNNAAMIATT